MPLPKSSGVPSLLDYTGHTDGMRRGISVQQQNEKQTQLFRLPLRYNHIDYGDSTF